MSTLVLGVDPGFASIGFALVRLLPQGSEEVVELGVIRTEKSATKLNVFASDDNVRRTRELTRGIYSLLISGSSDEFTRNTQTIAKAICAESMSYPRNSTNAAKVALCWGVLSSLSELLNVPLVQATPQQVKKLTAGSRSASKVDVQDALAERYGRKCLDGFLSSIPKTLHEHAVDALGVVVSCLDSEVLRLLRKV